jgi:hypothetical protein
MKKKTEIQGFEEQLNEWRKQFNKEKGHFEI